MVRDEMPVARLAQCGDLAQLGNALGQAAIRLDDVVAAAVDEQLKLMEFPVALSAGDVDVRFGPQPGKTLVVEFPKRLLEPIDVALLELARGGKRAAIIPLRGRSRRRQEGRLIGVDHNGHARSAAHRRIEEVEVLTYRLAVKAQLERMKTFGLVAASENRTIVWSAELGSASVGPDLVAAHSPQFVERQIGCLADDVPKRLVDEPGASRVAECARVELGRPGRLPDHVGSDAADDGSGLMSVCAAIPGDAVLRDDFHHREGPAVSHNAGLPRGSVGDIVGNR